MSFDDVFTSESYSLGAARHAFGKDATGFFWLCLEAGLVKRS